MYIRRALEDFDRLETLVNRAPRARQTEQFKFFVDEYRGRKSIISDAQNLPNKTPREQIWKALMEVTRNIDSEQIALPAMRQAMKVGASVGAKETFLRQNDEMGNLIIRIASESPTVYNEELASAMADRIRERRSVSTEAREGLTKRELEILRQLSTGRTLTVIASELHISQNTMKTHLKNLYRKMAVASRSEAVEKARSLYLL
jgi:DNA-binding NarL/FixJ family response regulator